MPGILTACASMLLTLPGGETPDHRWVLDRADERLVDQHGSLDARLVGTADVDVIDGVSTLLFDGWSGHVLVPGAAEALPTREFTLTAWVCVSEPTRWGGLIGFVQDNGDAEAGWVLGYNGTRFSFALATDGTNDGNGRMTYLDADREFELGRWYHVAGVYDGGSMRLYMNGELVGTSVEQSGDVYYPAKARMAIGAYTDDNEHYGLWGWMAEAELIGRALGVEELNDHRTRLAALAERPAQRDTRLRLLVEPYLQYVTPDGIGIMWETTREARSRVEYGTSLPLDQSVDLNEAGRIHEVRLQGLVPNTPYFYRTISIDELGQRLESEVRTFQTAFVGDGAFGFIVMGDTQSSPDVVRSIAALAWAHRPHFALHAGDLVSTGSDKSHWVGHYFRNMEPFISRVAVFPVLGNHEQNADWYYRYMALPEPEYYYDFRYGNAHFFMIDTNKPVGPETEQYAWLEARLASSDATWKFVVHHQPAYTSDENDYGDTWEGPSDQGDLNARQLCVLYDRFDVDIVFNGHIHVYERTWPIRAGKVVEDGVIYLTTGGAGGGLEQFAPTKPAFSNYVRRTHHLCYLAINGGTLQFRAMTHTGELFDTFEIRK